MTDTYAPVKASAFPDRIGQGTAVEQSRAVAEVQAAVLVARQFPRSESAAVERAQTACSQRQLAVRAFFRFPRGSSNVTGETIQLAKELARCWGNIQYGLVELRRDDEFGQSEMQAWAWDMESNERVSTTFIVPHARWANGAAQKLADFRDIYENNANNGARRLREMIFSVLPVWYVEKAKAVCQATLEKTPGDLPRPQRIAQAIAAFEGINITPDQIETKLNRPRDAWTDRDLGQLEVIYNSLQRGESNVEEEFPPPRQSVEEITQAAPPKRATRKAAAKQEEQELLPHEWTLEKVAEVLGMDDAALEERCQGVTGGSLAEATEAQQKALFRELANEMVAQDGAR